MMMITFLLPFILIGFFFLISWLRVLAEYERGVVMRLGRVLSEPVGPGLFVLLAPPFIDRMIKVDLRTVTLDVPPQDVITKDNVSIRVSAVVYYRVLDPMKAVIDIEDYHYATSQMAQTTVRSVTGQCEMDEILSQREKISAEIQGFLDKHTDPWGVKVANVEIKNVDLPENMQRAMARQAEAERDRRAKIISAEGEFQAAEKLVAAASMMEKHPMALQMRYLQTMVELGSERSSTIFFPFPMEFTEALKSCVSNGVQLAANKS